MDSIRIYARNIRYSKRHVISLIAAYPSVPHAFCMLRRWFPPREPKSIRRWLSFNRRWMMGGPLWDLLCAPVYPTLDPRTNVNTDNSVGSRVSHLGHRHSSWWRGWGGATQRRLGCRGKRMALGFDRFNFHLRAATHSLCDCEEMPRRLILRQDGGLVNLKSPGLKFHQDADSPPETTETLIILPVLMCVQCSLVAFSY